MHIKKNVLRYFLKGDGREMEDKGQHEG